MAEDPEKGCQPSGDGDGGGRHPLARLLVDQLSRLHHVIHEWPVAAAKDGGGEAVNPSAARQRCKELQRWHDALIGTLVQWLGADEHQARAAAHEREHAQQAEREAPDERTLVEGLL